MRALGGLAALALLCAAAPEPPLPHWTPDEDIVQHLEKQPDHKTFVALLNASGLRARLKGPGRFTVLAPTDKAFAALPPGMVRDLMKPSSKPQLAQVIGCHIVAREIKFGLGPVAPTPVATIGGCLLRFTRNAETISVHDENGIVARLELFDVFEANGQVEVIDGVLTPSLKSLKARYGHPGR